MTKMKLQFILLIITSLLGKLYAVDWGNLPPEIQKCKSTDNYKCVGKAIEDVLKLYPTGNQDLGIPNISAINITNLKVSRSNPDSPIQINFKFIQCTIYGVEKSKMLRVVGFDKELRKIEADVFVQSVRLKGDYEMTGKILLLPINGKGKGEIHLRDTKHMYRIVLEQEKRNNKTYITPKKVRAIVEPEQMFVKLDNVFSGNPVLSKTINDVINENWKEVWTELQGVINQAIETMLDNLLRETFQILTVEDMFLD